MFDIGEGENSVTLLLDTPQAILIGFVPSPRV